MQPCIALLLLPRTSKQSFLRDVVLRIKSECFASNCDVHAPWFDMFGQLFMDAELACDTLLQERISRNRNIKTTCRDALTLLVSCKCSGLVRLADFRVTALALAIHGSVGESNEPEKSCACPPMFAARFFGHNSLILPDRRIPTGSEHGMQFRRV